MVCQHRGWTNYPTWAVYTWLTLDGKAWFRKLIANNDLDLDQKADILEAHVQERNPLIDDDETMFCEVLTWALSVVNYREIIEATAADLLTEQAVK